LISLVRLQSQTDPDCYPFCSI
jgi:hypothetical protein